MTVLSTPIQDILENPKGRRSTCPKALHIGMEPM